MPVLTGVVEILIKGTVPTTGSGAKNIYNVFHFQSSSPPNVDSLGLIASEFVSQIWVNIAASLSSSYTGVESDCRLLDDATSQYVTGTVPTNGQVTGARMPSDISVAMLMRTTARGKNFRGGKRFGPIADGDVLGDELTAAAITAHWATTVVNVGNPISAGGGLSFSYRPVIVSRMLSQLAVNPTLITGAPVFSVLLNKTLGTMRKRKEKTVR